MKFTVLGLSLSVLAAPAANTCSGTPIPPGDPGTHDVLFTIDTGASVKAISPYVYGTNEGNLATEAKGVSLARVGGERLSAYNWETNHSNAGVDDSFENETYPGASTTAGEPMKQAVQTAADAGASILVTVPTAGWVAADNSGPVEGHPANASVIAQRFFPFLPTKGSAFSYPPNLGDSAVYADEFVWWLESQFPNAQTDPARRIFYMLDNEPDLWSIAHSEIHPDKATYAEIVQRSTDYASAIKSAAPNALVFAPSNYGWYGYVTLQDAPDGAGRDFLDFYLASMQAAETTAGKRLIDVLDVHWFPEALGDGKRIIDGGLSAPEVEARMQAPRSLWDGTYTESSWIAEWGTMGPIRLVPRLLTKIADHYPGTKLSISEYSYGAGGDISGGIAQADALGIFGREGVFAANASLLGAANDYLFGAFAMFRNYDGLGGKFGDKSVSATTSSLQQSTVYASTSSTNGSNVIVVAINKHAAPLRAGIAITHTTALEAANVYTLTSASAQPVAQTSLVKVATNAFNYMMPARSVSTLVFHP